MSVTVDDTSSSISYSQGWELLEGSRTLHSTWDTDCRATFSFRGTYVAVYGTIPRGGGETVVVDFAVDGGRTQRVYREAGRQTINDDLWYETGALSSGDHTLTMTYYEGDKDFQLDRIVYTPVAAPVNPPPAQVTTRETTIVQTQISTTTAVQTTAPQPLETPASSTGLPSSIPGASTIPGGTSNSSSAANFLPPNSNYTVTATQFIKTSDEQTTAEPSGTGTTGTSSSTSRTSVPTGTIVGAIIAGLTAIVFLLLLLFLIRRRRRRMRSTQAYLDQKKGLSNEAASEGGITPFVTHKEGSREALVSLQPLVASRKKPLVRSQVACGPAGAASQAEATNNSNTVVSSTPMPSAYYSNWNPTRGVPENGQLSAPFDVGNSSCYLSLGEASLLQGNLRFGSDSEVAPAYFPRGRGQEGNGPKSDIDANEEARGSGGGDNVRRSLVNSVLLPTPMDDLPPAYDRQSGS